MKDVTYFLGCPVWACTRWQGRLFTRDARRDLWLNQYSTVFPSVEGNSTFYGLPSHETVRRWIDSTLEPFHFILKFPRTISHDHRLLNAEAETDQFLQILQILKDTDAIGWTQPRRARHALDRPMGLGGCRVDYRRVDTLRLYPCS